MKRSDGKLVKAANPFAGIIPFIFDKRSTSQNFSKHAYITDSIDDYIRAKRVEGYPFAYLHCFIAAYVRLLAERPELNRFIMNNRIYQRNNICISMVVKRSFREDGEETTVKFEFTGQESIFEVAGILEKTIAEARAKADTSDVDALVEKIMALPAFVKRFAVRTLLGLDKVNLLPASVIKASPFHTSLFFTHLKSIKTDYIYHHLYDVGTAGIFVALGKKVKLPMVINDEIVIKNCIQVGYTVDERICDGVYFARSLKLLNRYLENPALLEQPLT